MGKIVNLSTFISDECPISIAMAIRTMLYSEIKPMDNTICALLSSLLPEYEKEILPFFSCKGEEPEFTTYSIDKRRESAKKKIDEIIDGIPNDENIHKRIIDALSGDMIQSLYNDIYRLNPENLFNAGIYNLAMLLHMIDDSLNMDEMIIYNNAIGNYSSGDQILIKKSESLPFIHLGVSQFIISWEQRKKDFQWDKHYNVAPDMNSTIKIQRKYQVGKEVILEHSPEQRAVGNCFLSDALLMIDLERIYHQCVIEKLLIALLFIGESPEYEEWMQCYAYTLAEILCEVFFCGEIHKVYFQEGYYDVFSEKEKTSKDATTRISIIFSAENEDVFVLRIDLPHQGVHEFHINMEEIIDGSVVETGYPIEYYSDEGISLRRELGNVYDDLFFEMNNQIWFRKNFKALLKKSQIEGKTRNKLDSLFRKQAHQTISIPMDGLETSTNQLRFMEEIKRYARRLMIKEGAFISFDKEDILYSKEVYGVRKIFNLREIIAKNVTRFGKDPRVTGKELMDLFSKCFEKDSEQNTDEEISLVDLWEKVFVNRR